MSIFNSEKACACSFCGKPHTSVIKLIAGPGIYICDECVIICSEILAKEIPEWPKHIRCPKDPIKVNHDMLKSHARRRGDTRTGLQRSAGRSSLPGILSSSEAITPKEKEKGPLKMNG